MVGTWHFMWNTLGQRSQHSRSPPLMHTAHQSSLGSSSLSPAPPTAGPATPSPAPPSDGLVPEVPLVSGGSGAALVSFEAAVAAGAVVAGVAVLLLVEKEDGGMVVVVAKEDDDGAEGTSPEPLNPEPLNPEPLNPEPLNPEQGASTRGSVLMRSTTDLGGGTPRAARGLSGLLICGDESMTWFLNNLKQFIQLIKGRVGDSGELMNVPCLCAQDRSILKFSAVVGTFSATPSLYSWLVSFSYTCPPA